MSGLLRDEEGDRGGGGGGCIGDVSVISCLSAWGRRRREVALFLTTPSVIPQDVNEATRPVINVQG